MGGEIRNHIDLPVRTQLEKANVMKNVRPLLCALVTATVALAQATARADSAANIYAYPTGSAVTYDDNGSGNYPVVSAILSAPGVVDGYTYKNWSYLAQDTTGSLDMFYSTSVVGGLGYTPLVGDTLIIAGNYSPFDGIPEIANSATHPLSVTYGTSGNPLYSASPVLTTIPTINVGTNGYGLSLSGLGGKLLQLNNVTISGAGANWTTHANVTGTITDQSANSMTMYLWASSYSTAGAIAAAGGPVPTGLVDMTGFISDFYSTVTSSIAPEFVPTSITVVPEPMAMTLWGFGAALAWVGYRLRRKA
jgi:hypothetical protein